MNKFLIVIIVLLFAVLALASFIAWQVWSNKNTMKQIPQVSQISPTPSPSPNLKKIAYVKDNSIWSINSDGTNKAQLLQSSPNKFLSQIVWKNLKTISYISCDTSCRITNIGAETNSEVPETENQILTLGWNHAGNQLAYIYRLPDGQMKMDFKTQGVTNTVKNFASPVGGRGGSLDDDVSIHFSPDNQHIIVTNTLTQISVNDKSTIWVFDTNGKEILNIESKDNSWPTQATWPNNTIFYKQGPDLYQRDIFTPESEKIGTIPNFFNPTSFAGVEKIYYWVNTEKLPYLGLFEGPGQKYSKFLDGYYKPQRIDNNNLAVLKAQLAPAGQEVIIPFVSVGLSTINVNTKETNDLDSGEISEFAISP